MKTIINIIIIINTCVDEAQELCLCCAFPAVWLKRRENKKSWQKQIVHTCSITSDRVRLYRGLDSETNREHSLQGLD